MTITIKKLHLAIAVIAIALIAPATALATHVFDDVPDAAFYADPVEWAATNDITTGRTPDLFDPEAGVTRGESVTFLKRYDDNIVQPAIAALPTIYTARVASAGTLVHGTSGVTSAKTSTGSYTVDFPADVVDCTWGATPTAAGGFLFVIDTTEIFATVSSAAASFLPPVSDPDTVIVNIFDEDGASQDWRFDLTIVC